MSEASGVLGVAGDVVFTLRLSRDRPFEGQAVHPQLTLLNPTLSPVKVPLPFRRIAYTYVTKNDERMWVHGPDWSNAWTDDLVLPAKAVRLVPLPAWTYPKTAAGQFRAALVTGVGTAVCLGTFNVDFRSQPMPDSTPNEIRGPLLRLIAAIHNDPKASEDLWSTDVWSTSAVDELVALGRAAVPNLLPLVGHHLVGLAVAEALVRLHATESAPVIRAALWGDTGGPDGTLLEQLARLTGDPGYLDLYWGIRGPTDAASLFFAQHKLSGRQSPTEPAGGTRDE